MARASSRTCWDSGAPGRWPSLARRGRPAFTLVELLVVVAIVGALVGILIPTLGAARSAAKDTVCQANLKTLAAAWVAYGADNDHFPWHAKSPKPLPSENPPYSWGWGGLDNTRETQAHHVFNKRPINEYLKTEIQSRRFVDVFRCPKDNGGVFAGTTIRLELDPTPFDFIDTSELNTWFGRHGNSYTCNDWVWAEVGRINGASGPPPSGRQWKHDLPLTAVKQPSMTAMLGDYGGLEQGPMTDQQIVQLGICVGWWHGMRKSTIAFWDGAARLVPVMPGGWTPDYWMWLQPDQHPPEGTPVARQGWIRNLPGSRQD